MAARPTFLVDATPVISTSIYASGDALGGKLEFTGAAQAGFGGVISKVILIDLDKELAEIDLVLFEQDFTPSADNAVFDPSDADMAYCLGYIKILSSDYVSFNDNAVATKRLVDPFRLPAGSTLYGQLVVRGTPTYTATSDIKVRLGILPD